jgi:hypothetical protein
MGLDRYGELDHHMKLDRYGLDRHEELDRHKG